MNEIRSLLFLQGLSIRDEMRILDNGYIVTCNIKEKKINILKDRFTFCLHTLIDVIYLGKL